MPVVCLHILEKYYYGGRGGWGQWTTEVGRVFWQVKCKPGTKAQVKRYFRTSQ